MGCFGCGKEGIVEVPAEGKSFCENCFCVYFERKVLNSLRGHLPSGGKVRFDTSTLGGRVAFHVIKPFALEARNKCLDNHGKADLLVVGDTLDDEALAVMKDAMGKGRRKGNKKTARPLMRCSDEEIAAYARIIGLSGPEKERDGFDSVLKEGLDYMEEKHPGTKYSILKSGSYLESLE